MGVQILEVQGDAVRVLSWNHGEYSVSKDREGCVQRGKDPREATNAYCADKGGPIRDSWTEVRFDVSDKRIHPLNAHSLKDYTACEPHNTVTSLLSAVEASDWVVAHCNGSLFNLTPELAQKLIRDTFRQDSVQEAGLYPNIARRKQIQKFFARLAKTALGRDCKLSGWSDEYGRFENPCLLEKLQWAAYDYFGPVYYVLLQEKRVAARKAQLEHDHGKVRTRQRFSRGPSAPSPRWGQRSPRWEQRAQSLRRGRAQAMRSCRPGPDSRRRAFSRQFGTLWTNRGKSRPS